MRVLLIQPKISSNMVSYPQLVRAEPLALEYIGSALAQYGNQVSLLDMRWV